jgi:hypothetical protein
MRPNPSLYLAFVAGLATGCTELDDPPVWVDFNYQVRCVDCVPMSFNDDPHQIQALDGDDGLDTSCIAEDGRIALEVTFDAEGDNDDWSFQLDGAEVGEDSPGNGCSVTVSEGVSEYTGGCTADDPSVEAPCQVELSKDDYVVSGTIFCKRIPNIAEQTVTRYVTRPGSDSMPFEIEIQNCEGL